ncbi:PP2C family protein-serine/threonine phosphatase [Amycolatopsis sp. NPDC005232]|uniref:PP2C family protein-serine/threonine phosphatase n=1 Tax=Amycolatopsis sp. NPDC005232 TaxID=3157027 RepID=UPI0033A54649
MAFAKHRRSPSDPAPQNGRTRAGRVRHALRAYAVEGHDLVGILDRLDAMLQRFHPRDLTTMCLILVDPESGAVEIASAGHIPPLTADARGVRYLDVRGPVLGIGLDRPAATSWHLEPGALVLLVTDGLIERRGETVDDGMASLATAVTQDTDLDELCDDLLERFGRNAQDDIALLAFRRR